MTKESPLLAMDRAPENRELDKFGRLHVRLSNICRASVNPYKGSEIPGYKDLGLDPEQVYQLYRPFEEIDKGAQSSNNIQLMLRHIQVTAEAPQKETVCGCTGTDAASSEPFLTNSLAIWDQEAIDAVLADEIKELSPGYAYIPEMTAGSFEGLHYDGIMRNITFNHVALVQEGRQGPEVVVGDEEPESFSMAKAVLKSRKAILVSGALTSALLPILAQDAKVDFSGLLSGVTAKNYKTSKPQITAGLKALTKGKLAQDANLDGVISLLDKLDDMTDGEEKDDSLEPAPAVDSDDDEDGEASRKAWLKSKLSEDDMAEFDKMCAPKPAAADEESQEADEEDPTDEPTGAMDAASVKKLVAKAEQRAVQRVAQVQSARELVEPIVGKVNMALDSAEPIYDLALDHLKIKAAGVNAAGKKLLIETHLANKGKGPTIALDAALGGDARAEFAKQFPNASPLRR